MSVSFHNFMCYHGVMSEGVSIHPAYIAGIIDGEGTLTIGVNKARSWKSPHYQVEIIVTMSSQETINALHRFQPGGKGGQYKNHPRWKEQYRWTLSGKTALKILKQVLPYLICKRRHAELLIEMQESKINPITQATGHKGLPDSVNVRRSEIVVELRKLNKRGH